MTKKERKKEREKKREIKRFKKGIKDQEEIKQFKEIWQINMLRREKKKTTNNRI